MGTSRRCAAAVAAITALLTISGCGTTPVAATATLTSAAATPSVGSPGGAFAGFLQAARDQDNGQVPVWLATTADTTDLNELLRVYAGFGSSGGVFWEVNGLMVTDVTNTGAGRAHVTLGGDIVWCLGKAANDPAATCSAVTGVPGTSHTYAAVQVDGSWKVDVDVNASTGLDHNPQASGTATAPTPS